MQSYSQAGQDLFVYHVLGQPRSGVYLEIGAGDPIDISNTKMLEDLGWSGIAVEISPSLCDLYRSKRKNEVFCENAESFLVNRPPLWNAEFDYISLDVDASQERVLELLIECSVRGRVLTVETNRYLWGDDPDRRMREKLEAKGYEVIASDVCHGGRPFEVWLVDTKLVNMDLANRFRSHNMDWKDILKQAGISL